MRSQLPRPLPKVQRRSPGFAGVGASVMLSCQGGERSHGRLDSDRRARQSEVAKPAPLETTMQVAADRTDASTAIQTDLPAIFVSLELSRSTWLITSLSPGAGEKMSKHSIRAGDVAGLLVRLAQLKEKARGRTGRDFPIIAIQEAGLDGFWIHRVLQSEGIESHVVDAASILTSRRRRRAKTDGIDGETLVRTLLAYKRGEPEPENGLRREPISGVAD